jgi:hypothetical protein
MGIAGIRELVLETDDVSFDPAGNRVELWGFFGAGDGAEVGVMALAEDGDGT